VRRGILVLVVLLPLGVAAQGLKEAHALADRGDLAGAQAAFEALLPKLRGHDDAGLGEALYELGQVAWAKGDYDKALERNAEAAEVFHRLGDAFNESRALDSRGSAGIFKGDYPGALHDLNAALAIERAHQDREGQIDSLNNIGTVHYMQAGYVEALRAYREALELVERGPTENWTARKRAISVANLAALYQRLGQEQQALSLYQSLGKDQRDMELSERARLLTNEGALYRRLDDPQKALKTYREAMALLSKGENLAARIGVLKNIGIVEALDLERPAEALTPFREAVQLAEQTGNRRDIMQARLHLGETCALLGENAKSREEFEAALAVAKELGAVEEQWKALYGLGRALREAGDKEAAAARFREAIAAIESARAKLQLPSLRTDFLADKRDVYDALVELTLPTGDAKTIFDLLERSRARNFQDRIARAPPTLDAVQARLGPGALLVEFWTGPHGSAALWATSNRTGIVRVEADPAQLEELVKRAAAGSDFQDLARSIGDRLLGAVPLSEARVLLVVPDGPLATIPFDVLAPGGGPMLIERLAIAYQPSAALLLRDPPKPGWSFPWKRQLVAFADPRLGTASGRLAADTLGGKELQAPLPASADEARGIARFCHGRAQLNLGPADLKQRFISTAASAPLLHLATHATADMTVPERSRILFSPQDAQNRADYVFLKEVYGLDLRGVDLATLSACDTERGKTVRGEGVQGFSRALLAAGARSSITALWRVSDGASRELMKQLYYELNRGVPKAEALRNAKLRLLRSSSELRDPKYWAAFVLSGDGVYPVPRFIPWSWFFAGLAVAVLIGAGVHHRRRSV
jgi:tetratricopeptide (TPR) repeat protein